MADTMLMLHCGAQEVSRAQLDSIPAPAATETWFPAKHADVLDAVLSTLDGAGFAVERQRLSVASHGHRMFGTLDLRSELATGVTLAVGIRNSTDQTLPLGFCAGSRVFVCDNLAFRSELLVNRKHTKNGSLRFREAISQAVLSLPQFMAGETERVELMRTAGLTDQAAESLMLRAYERHIVSSRLLPETIRAWREPDTEEFAPRTVWSLLNAFTRALKPRSQSNPQEFALTTMQLYRLLNPETDSADDRDFRIATPFPGQDLVLEVNPLDANPDL